MHAESGVIPHSGEYRVIDRPRRLVFTWVSPHTGERESLVTVDFLPRGKRTEVVVTHEQLPEAKREAHNGGWTSALENLDAFRAPARQKESHKANPQGNSCHATHSSHHLPMGTGLRPGPGERPARPLGTRGSRPCLRGKLLNVGEHNSPAHRALQPFGQVPVYEEDGLTLFESGAIVMHIGRAVPHPAAHGSGRDVRGPRLDVCGVEFPRAGSSGPGDHRPVLCQ